MTNNKLREALLKSRKAMDEMSKSIFQGWIDDGLVDVLGEAQRAISSALAKPIRNCDIGTAEEQTARALEYCSQFPSKDGRCVGCPLDDDSNSYTSCMCRWSQMPYEEEGAE